MSLLCKDSSCICFLDFQQLYQNGARTFWIHNTGPLGCLPTSVIYNPSQPDDTDTIGCVKSYNEVAQEFNRQLKEKVSDLRSQLSDVLLTYVDVYSAKYELISGAEKHGNKFHFPFLKISIV